MVGKLVDFLKILHRRVIFFKLALCQRKHADDAVHRRANLMRHAGKEHSFRLVGFFRLHQTLFIALYAALHFSRFVKSEKVVFFCAALHNVHRDPLAVLHAEFCGQMISQKLFPSISKSFVNIFMRHSPFSSIVSCRRSARPILPQTVPPHYTGNQTQIKPVHRTGISVKSYQSSFSMASMISF